MKLYPKRGAFKLSTGWLIVIVLAILVFTGVISLPGLSKQSSLGGNTASQVTNGGISYGDISTLNTASGSAALTSAAWNRYYANSAGFGNPYDSPGSGSPTVGTSYCGSVSACAPQSISNALSQDFFESISASNAYQMAFDFATACGSITSVSTCSYSPAGYPAAQYTATLTAYNNAPNGHYWSINAYLPSQPASGTSALTHVNMSILAGFAGSSLPASGGSLDFQIKATPGTDACVSDNLLGTVNSPITNYATGAKVNNGVVESDCFLLILSNQSATFSVNSGGQSLSIPGVTTTAGVKASLIQVTSHMQSSASEAVADEVADVNVQVVPVTTTGHTAIVAILVDNQQYAFINQNIANQISGTFTCATSGTFCGNSSDIVVGTPYQNFGIPGLFSFSGWATPTSGNNAGWAAVTLKQTAGVVYTP